jgi:hypothetical protein
MQELMKPAGLEELAGFVAVAESGSFAEAAKKLSGRIRHFKTSKPA